MGSDRRNYANSSTFGIRVGRDGVARQIRKKPGRSGDPAIAYTEDLQRTVGNQGVEHLIKSGMIHADTIHRKVDSTPAQEAKSALASVIAMKNYSVFSDLNSQGLFGPIQAKMKVGGSNDAYEQEADRVAEKVVTMTDAAVQMKPHTIQRQYQNQSRRTPAYVKPIPFTVNQRVSQFTQSNKNLVGTNFRAHYTDPTTGAFAEIRITDCSSDSRMIGLSYSSKHSLKFSYTKRSSATGSVTRSIELTSSTFSGSNNITIKIDTSSKTYPIRSLRISSELIGKMRQVFNDLDAVNSTLRNDSSITAQYHIMFSELRNIFQG